MTISKDRVKPSPLPDSWKLKEIFTTGVIIGTYLAIMTVIFYWAAAKTTFFNVSDLPLTCNGIKTPHDLLCMQNKCGLNKFILCFLYTHCSLKFHLCVKLEPEYIVLCKIYLQDKFSVEDISKDPAKLTAAVYLQVSIVSQALIFVTRSRSWSFVERPGVLLLVAFAVAQLVTLFLKYIPLIPF